MNQFFLAVQWILTAEHWTGPGGIAARIGEHLIYTLAAVVLAAVVAIPLGLYIGHTGRGRTVVVSIAGAARALPSLGLLTFLAVAMGLGLSGAIVPSTIVLAILAVPPLLASTYAGVGAIDAEVIDGARATGLTEAQIVSGVEIPLARPMILGGLRSATLQVIATATISAYVGLGGLGRYILDGLPVRDYAQMLAGAILVTGVALLCDALLTVVARFVR